MAAKSKPCPNKDNFVQQSNRIMVIQVGFYSGNVDTIIKLLYKCVRPGFRIVPQFSTRIDIPEIKTESSFHSGVNMSKTNCKIIESFYIYKNTQLKKQNTQMSIS